MADKHGVAIKGRGLLTGFQHELSRWRNSSGQTLLLASVIQGGGQGSVSSKALEFECVYIVRDPGYNLYMDIQQAINFHLLERFTRIGAKFAVPVRAIKVTALPQPFVQSQVL